jgi:hypothetical protein
MRLLRNLDDWQHVEAGRQTLRDLLVRRVGILPLPQRPGGIKDLARIVAHAFGSGPPQAPANPNAPAPAPASPPPAAGQRGQGSAAAAPAGSKTPAPSLAFTGDAGLVLFTVKADAAAEFESFLARVKEALAKGTKPEYKQMAAGWKLYKVADAPQNAQVIYAALIDPAVKGSDYDPIKILSDVAPADAVALYPKLKDAIVSVNRLNLGAGLSMGQ